MQQRMKSYKINGTPYVMRADMPFLRKGGSRANDPLVAKHHPLHLTRGPIVVFNRKEKQKDE